MGFLNFFRKAEAEPTLLRIPSGSFTVDASGSILASTLPQSFPKDYVVELKDLVLSTFQDAQDSGIPMRELIIEYGALKVIAREMRGGAIVFLAPQSINKN